MVIGFNYIKNCFYIEDLNSIISNSFYGEDRGFDMTLLNGQVSDPEQLERKISVNHELNHYLQDISINACITEGYFLDYISAFSRELTHNSHLRFPLMNKENRLYNEGLINKLDKSEWDKLVTLYQVFDVYKYIYRTLHVKPNRLEYDLGDKLNDIFDQYGISFKYILESYAFHKAYIDCFLQDAESDDTTLDLIAEVIRKDRIYPFQYKNGKIYSENFKRDIDYKAQYQYLDFLLLISCLPVSTKEYLDYCEKDIPRNYRKSVAIMAHSAKKIIIETALNIPSFNFIMSSVKYKKYSIEVFSPVHRIFKIIKTIRDNNGYPNAKTGEDFFITFFNWCAAINHWPTYEESMGSVFSVLTQRAEQGKECITNYQATAIIQKNNAYGKFSQALPIEWLSKLCLPLIISNKHGLEIMQLMGNCRYAPSGLLDFYQIWFNMPVHKYTPINKEMPLGQLYEAIFNNQKGAIREILSRLFSKAAANALTEDGYFKCPLAENGCIRRTEQCEKFKSFTSVLQNCKNYVFRCGNQKSFENDSGRGNFPDCMFLNYLYDYKYNLNKLKAI